MKDTSEQHEGGCLCGAIRYTLHSEPTYSGHCHCRSCQKAIGAGFVTWVGVKPENFEVTKGRSPFARRRPVFSAVSADDVAPLSLLPPTVGLISV